MKRIISRLLLGSLSCKVSIISGIVFNKPSDVEIGIRGLELEDWNRICFDKRSYIYPLLSAVFFESREVVQYMLGSGRFDPDHLFHGYSAPTYGILHCYKDDKFRFSSSVYPPSKNLGWDLIGSEKIITPTILALSIGNSEILRLCLEHGGNLRRHFRHESIIQSLVCKERIPSLSVFRVLLEYDIIEPRPEEIEGFKTFLNHFIDLSYNVEDTEPILKELFSIIELLIKEGGFEKMATEMLSDQTVSQNEITELDLTQKPRIEEPEIEISNFEDTTDETEEIETDDEKFRTVSSSSSTSSSSLYSSRSREPSVGSIVSQFNPKHTRIREMKIVYHEKRRKSRDLKRTGVKRALLSIQERMKIRNSGKLKISRYDRDIAEFCGVF